MVLVVVGGDRSKKEVARNEDQNERLKKKEVLPFFEFEGGFVFRHDGWSASDSNKLLMFK